jgi:hypothetical protein
MKMGLPWEEEEGGWGNKGSQEREGMKVLQWRVFTGER